MRAILGAVLVFALAGGTVADEKPIEKKEEKKDDKKPEEKKPPREKKEDEKKDEDEKKEDVIDARKLIGKWELVKPTLIAKLTAEFQTDEQMALTTKFGDVGETTTGSYKIIDGKLIQALRGPEGEDKRIYKITKLSDDALEYELNGVPYAFKKIKKDDKK